MGLAPAELADIAYQLALGGIDLIKDDHGLADQSFCRFEERVPACAESVARANRETGLECLYLANVTAPFDQLLARARRARDEGAGGLVVAPGLTGFDGMRYLAQSDEIGLPILCHPALLGSHTASADAGIAHSLIYGLLPRLAGADGSIFPSYGGRFSFSRDECAAIAAGCARYVTGIASAFPVPAGGMTVDRVPELIAFYGTNMVLLIGGDLHRNTSGLTDACRAFVRRASALS
jgi:ribulose-bisphosphate carboxylase large chain